MYYLDFHELYRPTTKLERILIRSSLRRNEVIKLKLVHQHYLCFFCGTEIDIKAHLDHLIPVYYGGTNKLSNLVASCSSCNLTKGTDQIEITNQYTINDYLRLIKAYDRVKGKPYAYKVKRYHLYKIMRADLFKYKKTATLLDS